MWQPFNFQHIQQQCREHLSLQILYLVKLLNVLGTDNHFYDKLYNWKINKSPTKRPERGDGFQLFSEQVSHHPPISAIWAKGNAGWLYEVTVDVLLFLLFFLFFLFFSFLLYLFWIFFKKKLKVESAFKGTSLEVYPKGYNNVTFPAFGDRISYLKITTCVHNIVIGKMWVDNVFFFFLLPSFHFFFFFFFLKKKKILLSLVKLN